MFWDEESMLNQSEYVRYSRQLLLEGFGVETQERLKDSHVVIAGVGGLGGCSSLFLVAAGVGHITIIDDGFVELSNLNRQILYRQKDLGKAKTSVAHRTLSQLNPEVNIVPIRIKITEQNVLRLIKGAQVIVDGTDNLRTRLILNAACVKTQLPFVYGGVYGLKGMMTTIIPDQTPCLECIYPQVYNDSETIPVLGAVPSVIGTLQALEAVKLITRIGTPLMGKLLSFDGRFPRFVYFDVERNESCTVCHNPKP